MAEGQEFFCGEIAVRKLVAEKDPGDRGDGEHAASEILLPLLEFEHRHVVEDLYLPGAPDGNFQHHHEEQFETWASVHRVGLRRRLRDGCRRGKQRASFVSGSWSVVSGHWLVDILPDT